MAHAADTPPTPERDQLEIHSLKILNSLPDGITVQDRDYRVIYQNDAMRAAFGDCRGQLCHLAYEKKSSRCEGCGIFGVFQSGAPTLVVRTAVDDQNQIVWWENACFPIRDDFGNIFAAAEVCRNITDRIGLEAEVQRRDFELGQVNDQLKKRSAELAEALRNLEQEVLRRERADLELRHAQKLQAIGQLAAGIAHEINTPLQYVGDNLQFLADGLEGVLKCNAGYRAAMERRRSSSGIDPLPQDAERGEQDVDLRFFEENLAPAFRQTQEGVARISTIVKAMKEFAYSRGEAKAHEDINRALSVVLTIARSEYADVAEVWTEFGEIPSVLCRIGDLNQVFLNLLVNAAHAIAEAAGTQGNKGRITVRTCREGDCVRIDIGDTGSGIPEAIRDRIFEPFFTTKEVGRGTGQGLAIAHSIVVGKHGGSLTFESRDGDGTTFSVRLPIEEKLQTPVACYSPLATIRALQASLDDAETP